MTQIPPGLIAGLILVPLTLTCFWIAYVAHAYTDKAEAFLIKSDIVKGTRSTYLHAGLFGKVMRNAVLSFALMIPGVCVRKGLLDLNEVRDFPKGLKRMLVVSWGLLFMVSVALVVSSFCC